MFEQAQEYAEHVLRGDRRAVARLITLIENHAHEAREAMQLLYPSTGKAFLVGITGPPGAGKSSLVDLLITAIRQDGLKVGVVAIDPSSPFSGGAILGDRIRMKSHAADPEVFIRSMSSRGQLGGLALATRSACEVLDAYGCDVIIVETVGVGQSEIAIAQAADCTVLVLPPNLGDGIQAIKAGIMEVPDCFVVNKSDLAGARQAVAEIKGMLELAEDEGWTPPVLQTKSLEPLDESGVRVLWDALKVYQDYLRRTGLIVTKRGRQAYEQVESLALDELQRALRARMGEISERLKEVQARHLDPHLAARELVASLLRSQSLT